MYLLGYDIGSSSVKSSIVSIETGKSIANAFSPQTEMPISSPKHGWAEQSPVLWWENLKKTTGQVLAKSGISPQDIKGIGIAFQMHGLVLVDQQYNLLYPAIIWCDSRAIPFGNRAAKAIGEQKCFEHLFNLPGNFTASKLAWVKENLPDIYRNIGKIMLPGDYITLKLTGHATTTVEGLCEGTFWDFKTHSLSHDLIDYFGFSYDFFPPLVPNMGYQGVVNHEAAEELGLVQGIPISYRAGDQPNNAVSLSVFHPGEVVATAGTSGVIYAIVDREVYDLSSKINIFAHPNHTQKHKRLGLLLCINGAGAMNSWARRNLFQNMNYPDINRLAERAPLGADGLKIFPFGNGAERFLDNDNSGATLKGLNFNIHGSTHLARAVQEGVAFSFCYGMEAMASLGVHIQTLKTGNANMFLSPLFCEIIANNLGCNVVLYDTDGATGAARACGIGLGLYRNEQEAFSCLKAVKTISPNSDVLRMYKEVYQSWRDELFQFLGDKSP